MLRKVLGFFSLTVLTQVVLLMNQLVLLPVQIHVWGAVGVADWYAAMAAAMLMTVADLGLRNAGHASLLRAHRNSADTVAEAEFQRTWAWNRILIGSATVLLVALDVAQRLARGEPYPMWRAVLIAAYAVETVVVVRIMYFDSLALYNRAELHYLVLASVRLVLGLVVLVVLRAPPGVLAGIYLAGSLIGVWLQDGLARDTGRMRLAERLPPGLSWRELGVVRHTAAEPATAWARLSLPVLVVSAVATPLAVTTFVAMRAIFGAARQVVLQLSRLASVEHLHLREGGRSGAAQMVLGGAVAFACLFGAAVGAGVVTDDLRILGLWAPSLQRDLFLAVAVSFGASAAFYAYQIFTSLMFRSGEVRRAAGRQYVFLAVSALAAGVAIALRSLPTYLALLPASEILLAVLFMASSDAGRRGIALAGAGALAVVGLYDLARLDPGGAFTTRSWIATGEAAGGLALVGAALAGVAVVVNLPLIRAVLAARRRA